MKQIKFQVVAYTAINDEIGARHMSEILKPNFDTYEEAEKAIHEHRACVFSYFIIEKIYIN